MSGKQGRLLLAILACLWLPPAGATAKTELRLYTWPEYMDPQILADFEQQRGIRVREVHYESDEAKEEWLLLNDGRGVDLVIGASSTLAAYPKRGWLLSFKSEQIPNLKHLAPEWLAFSPSLQGYAVPYLWGTLGIAYREDKLGQPIRRWTEFYHPKTAWKGRVLAVNDSRELLGMALKALGYSSNSEEAAIYEPLRDLIQAFQPLGGLGYLTFGEDNPMARGEIWMAMVYSGDGLALMDTHPEIRYVIPEEGTSLWLDYIGVMAASPHAKEALAFIDFLHEPRQAARLAEYLGYATPNQAALPLTSAEHRANPLIYPAPPVLAKSEPHKRLSSEAWRLRNRIFSLMNRAEGQ